jgi:hypothetical protein
MASNHYDYLYTLTAGAGQKTDPNTLAAATAPATAALGYSIVDTDGVTSTGDVLASGDTFTVGTTTYTYWGTATVSGSTNLIAYTGTGNSTQFYMFSDNGSLSTTPFNNKSAPSAVSKADAVICFLAGTQIATPDGERSIESLKIGDPITLADGSAKPIKWLGKMTVPLHQFNRHSASPILIRAGALGGGLPKRDLYTSFRHGFAVEGVLVIAGLLVNGTSIVQCSDWQEDTVTFYQVEVEGHELMLAESAPSETFGEHGENRSRFDNAAEFHALYPDAIPAEPMPLGRVMTLRQLPSAVKARIEAAAIACGYAKKVAVA